MRSASALLGALLLSSVNVYGHGFHTTLTEMHWRPERRSLEVSLLVADPDLRAAVGKDLVPAKVEVYLQTTFQVRTGTVAAPLRLAGRERERRGHWLHFELALPTLAGARLHHSVLRNTEPFALHTVELHRPGQAPQVHTLAPRGPPLALDGSSVKER